MIKKVTVNAQSSIRIGGDPVIYFDPFMIEKETHDADVIFFTHCHSDHLSGKDFKKVAKSDTVYVCPSSMINETVRAGAPKDKIICMDAGEKKEILGIPAEAVPAYNIGKPMHPKRNGWLGYIITIDGERLYICGDIDAIPEGKKVKCDIIFVPIGGTFTMNAKQAAGFVNEVMPKIAVPIHYGAIVGKPKDADKFKKLVSPDIDVTVLIK